MHCQRSWLPQRSCEMWNGIWHTHESMHEYVLWLMNNMAVCRIRYLLLHLPYPALETDVP